MAATVATKTETAKGPKAAVPTVVIISEFKGTPTCNVGPEDNQFRGLSAGVGKWTRLFGVDKDGDSVLFEVFKFALANARNTAERDEIIGAGELFAMHVKEMVEAAAKAE